MLAACNVRWPEMFKRSFHVRTGLEHHMKEVCDRYFVLLDQRLSAWETEKWLLTTADVCTC